MTTVWPTFHELVSSLLPVVIELLIKRVTLLKGRFNSIQSQNVINLDWCLRGASSAELFLLCACLKEPVCLLDFSESETPEPQGILLHMPVTASMGVHEQNTDVHVWEYL